MNRIDSIHNDTDIAFQQLSNFYDSVKRWEAYLNHYWCEKIKHKYESLTVSREKFMDNIQNYVKGMRFRRNSQDDIDNLIESLGTESACSSRTIGEFLNQQEKFQIKLNILKRFPPEKYFHKNLTEFQTLLDRFKEHDVYILDLRHDWLQDDKKISWKTPTII